MSETNNTFTLADYEMDNTDLLVGDRDFGSEKEYKLNGQFKMHVTRVGKPFASKFNGLPQVPTTVQAVDSDGNVVGEETTIWLTLPVTPKDANENQVKDALKARDELIGILRAKSDEFSAYRKEGSGKDARYYAPDGTVLTGKQIAAARSAAQRKAVEAAKQILRGEMSLLDTEFYVTRATYTSKRDGQLKAKWQGFGPTPNPKVPVIAEPEFFYEGK